jgi:uncharacterized protein YktB (UPF0637 family)
MKYIKTFENFINEDADDMVKPEEEPKDPIQNYMFFQNIKRIKEAVDKLLTMDYRAIDNLLSDGHDWASDHTATAKDDIDEVYQFIKTHIDKEASILDKDEHTKE